MDIIRATAILLVVYCHMYIFLYPSLPAALDVFFNASSWFSAYLGVDLFFVLSGFLIGGIFFSKVHAESNKKAGLSNYFISRFCRTLPNYFLYLLIATLLYTLVQGKAIESGFWRYFVFLQKADPEYRLPILGVSWSLAVEEWFYLLFPCFYIIIWRLRGPNAYLGAAFGLMLLSLLVKIGYAVQHPGPGSYSEAFNFSTFFRLDSIAWGILAAYVWQTRALETQLTPVVKRRLFVFSLVSMLVLLAYIILFLARNQQYAWAYIFFAPCCSVSLLLAFPFLIQIKYNDTSAIHRFILSVSRVSYSLYLAHTLVIETVSYFFERNGVLSDRPALRGWVQIFMDIPLFSGLSFITYRFVELPCIQLKALLLRRLSHRGPEVAP